MALWLLRTNIKINIKKRSEIHFAFTLQKTKIVLRTSLE